MQNERAHFNSAGGLFTDLYALTMMQGYYRSHRNFSVVFDMFFRSIPFENGFSVFAGLETLLRQIEQLRFTEEDLAYLTTLNLFDREFLSYLRDFRFTGDIYAMPEGSVCFPQEPLLRVHAPVMEAQLIEGTVLNIINYQTLIATKSARMCLSAKGKKVVEFGLRRAHGPNGALSASRAAFIGGVAATSNVQAGREFGIPVTGTMSHAWVMSFDSEKEAFETYAAAYPDSSVFLLDTYDTLGSGIQNAIAVGSRIAERGGTFGVRLDSGDIEYLTNIVRERLDAAGLTSAFIVVSNELDEKIIAELTAGGCAADVWGVGTSLVTGDSHPAFSGVYKLSARARDQKLSATERAQNSSAHKIQAQAARHDGEPVATQGFVPVMKISNNIQKSSLPAVKQVYRYSDVITGQYIADLITLDEDFSPPPAASEKRAEPTVFYHPFIEHEQFTLRPPFAVAPLLTKVMESGQACVDFPTLEHTRAFAQAEVLKLDRTVRRRLNPHSYKVSISEELKRVRDIFITEKNA